MASFMAFYCLDRLISALFARKGETHSHTHMANAPEHSHPDLSQMMGVCFGFFFFVFFSHSRCS
jgi:hypothetical protein